MTRYEPTTSRLAGQHYGITSELKALTAIPLELFFVYQLQSPKAITETIEDVWSFDLETGKSVFLFQVDPWEPTPKLISDEHSRAASLHLPLNRQKSLSRILSKQII